MRLRLVQKDIGNTRISDYLDATEGTGLDIICFGELATTGCLYEPRDVDSLDTIVAPLTRHTVGIMLGAPRAEKGNRFNSYLYLHNSHLQVYDKIHLFPPFDEDKVFTPGTAPGLFETPFGNFGVAICYDVRFDEIFTRLDQLRVPTTIIPAAFPRVRIDQWRNLLIGRAVDSGTTVIGINSVGNDGRNEFGGSTMVVTPDGEILAQAGETAEEVIDVDL